QFVVALFFALNGQGVLFVQPAAEIDQPATLAAEGHGPRRGRVDRLFADRAKDRTHRLIISARGPAMRAAAIRDESETPQPLRGRTGMLRRPASKRRVVCTSRISRDCYSDFVELFVSLTLLSLTVEPFFSAAAFCL